MSARIDLGTIGWILEDGDPEPLREIIAQLEGSTAGHLATLKDALAAGGTTIEPAKRAFHAMKGSFALVGAVFVQAHASRLEGTASFASNDLDELTREVDEAFRELKQLAQLP